MASELKQGRRRTISSASSTGRSGLGKGQSRQIPQPKSSHTSDEFLQPFLNPSFDPAAFINTTLPPLQHRSAPSQSSADPGSLTELSAQAQTMLTQLNAQTTRLSNTLTQLTDDILRSGSRLAYEVELLRGETLSLTESMNETLQDDIKKFIPEGLQEGSEGKDAIATENVAQQPTTAGLAVDTGEAALRTNSSDPAYIQQLQTLTHVRARLESVIKTFGDAMEFVFPPSEVSVSSSFLSVSAPEPGSQSRSSEDKGQQVLRQIRDEVSGLLIRTEDPVQGIERAAHRIEELKELTTVWRGTAEEKGRSKFIESLAKMVEDRHRDLLKELEQAARRDGKAGGSRARKGSISRDGAVGEDAKALPGGFGLMSQLQRLRSGL